VKLKSAKAIPEFLKAYLIEVKRTAGSTKIRSSFWWPLLAKTAEAGPDQVVTMLADSKPAVRAASCHLLALMGPRARHTMDALVEVLTDPDPQTRRKAAFALRQIGVDHKSLPALQDSEWLVRFYAVEALGSLGPQAAPAAAALQRLARDESPEIRQATFEALKRLEVQ
jgi:HEAT repeat protein